MCFSISSRLGGVCVCVCGRGGEGGRGLNSEQKEESSCRGAELTLLQGVAKLCPIQSEKGLGPGCGGCTGDDVITGSVRGGIIANESELGRVGSLWVWNSCSHRQSIFTGSLLSDGFQNLARSDVYY